MKNSVVKNLICLTVLFSLCFIVFIAVFAFGEVNTAEGLIDTSVAVKAGNGEDLWNDEENGFNEEVMNDLIDKLFGNVDPASYIIENGSEDYETYGESVKLANDEIPEQYYVVPASTINAKLKNENGLVVKLGGYEWMATSLTFADIDGEESIVLTLYLSNEFEKQKYYINRNATRGNNTYSKSTVRNHLLTDAKYSFFSSTEENGFARNYLVQPKYIKYQYAETIKGRDPSAFQYNLINDALGELSEGWYNNDLYKPDEIIGDYRYDAWGDDYIWLPSLTEVGSSNGADTTCIWKLSASQRKHNGSSYAWLRSGQYSSYMGAHELQASGKNGASALDSTANGVLPAIHLNLSAAKLGLLGTTLKDPKNIIATYNGEAQTLKSVYNEKPKAVNWYNRKWYEHTPEYIKVTPSEEAKNVGEYFIKVEITQQWHNDSDMAIEEEGKNNGWTPDQTTAEKLKRRPKFAGTPDTTDAEHMESETVRWFKLIIEPKEVTVTKPAYNASTGVLTPPTFADESELYADKPALATKFTGTAENGKEFDQIDKIPNRRGTYTAQAVLVNSETDKTEYTGNYVIKDASNMTCTVQINRVRLPIPATTESSKLYTGEELEFALTGYSSEWAEVAQLKLPSGVTLKGSDADGWKLAATDAGSYDVVLSINSADQTDYCWDTANASEESVTDRTFTITVTRKTLTVDFTSSSGAFLLQAGAAVILGAEPSNAVTRDDVELTLEYFNSENPAVRFPVTTGTLDASTLSPGTYYLVATLDDSVATGNKNYKLDGGETRQEFTVSSKNITIDSVNWQYSQNNGVPTSVVGGAGASASSPFEVTYNGNAYVFAVNTNGLADAGVKVDSSYGTNGYVNCSQTNAGNAIAVTVRLIPFDESFNFNDASGKPLPNQYKDFTLYVKVNKANIDFSGVVWSANELEYNAVNQSVSIKSGLPGFLSVTSYSEATHSGIGEYTARVMGLTVTNQTAAANYNIPTSAQIAAEPALTHAWKIIKKKIYVVWVTTEETQGGNVIFVPSVSDNSKGAIEYTYYNEDKSRNMTLGEIFADYSPTTMKNYWVCARLKTSGGDFNATNCELIEGSEVVTESYQGFQAGENKNPVRVGLKVNKVTYNGSAQPAVIESEGGGLSADNDFTITYTLNGVSCGVPTNAGLYRVHVSLNNGLEGEYAITGQCEFDYEIEKANYDVSGMKWVDTLNGDAEYTGPYTWEYNSDSDTKGKVHNLSFVGDNIDGLTVNYTNEDALTGSDAGDYTVTVVFSVRDPLNYNVPENIEFTWTINPYTPDLSGVTWNYSTGSPFVFRIEDGTPVEYSVYLSGLPEGLDALIEYGGDTGAYSDAGSHVTSFTIKESDPNRKNYGELVFGAGLETRLVWEIKTKLIDKAEQSQTRVYRPEGYTFAEITNLPEDWAQYFNVTVLSDLDGEVSPTGGTWTFTGVDRYRIQIVFRTGMNTSNGGTTDNVKWSNNTRGTYQITLRINKLAFNINGWTDGEENARATLDAENVSEIERFFDYVLVNKDTGAEVPINSTLSYDTYYTIALKLKDEYKGNVELTYNGVAGETTAPYTFKTGADPLADPPENFYRKPTGDELTVTYRYTGKAIAFEFGDWFVSDKMEAIEGELSGTEVGDYEVKVGFKRGSLSAWGTEDDYDTSPVIITFIIEPRGDDANKFTLTDSASTNHTFRFGYDDFTDEPNVNDYVYNADKLLYITRLAPGNTLADLLAQFANAADITVYAADGTPVTDMTRGLATGMTLRIYSGDTLVNMLTVSVLGDVNGDGDITVADKTQLNAYMLGRLNLAGARLLSCNINNDTDITVADKTQLNAYMLGKLNIYDGLVLPSAPAQASAPAAINEASEIVTEPMAYGAHVITATEIGHTETAIEETTAPTVEPLAQTPISSASRTSGRNDPEPMPETIAYIPERDSDKFAAFYARKEGEE